jgi:DNA-binding CsgD family transcriptional regulator
MQWEVRQRRGATPATVLRQFARDFGASQYIMCLRHKRNPPNGPNNEVHLVQAGPQEADPTHDRAMIELVEQSFNLSGGALPPMLWTANGGLIGGDSLPRPSVDFFDRQRKFGLRGIVAAPILRPWIHWGFAAIGFCSRRVGASDLRHVITELSLLTQQIQVDRCNFVHRLTEREQEVLRWAALGKTSGETAAILGLSERTVNGHLTAAQQKLGCANRTATVAVAVARGVICI